MTPRIVFISGGTGYMGRALIPRLLERGHRVIGLVRAGSAGRLAAGAAATEGNALDASSFAAAVPEGSTFVHLVGVAHPGPAKAKEFRSIDLVAVKASVAAATGAGVSHFVYLSVAQPAPVMKVYQEVRAEGEALLRAAGMNATFLRPWYVLGPGHLWPYLLVPLYKVLELLPPTRDDALRMGLVTLPQMTSALVEAVEHPPSGVRIVAVPEIRRARA